MVENVQVINKNGDGMFTEGIAYIENIATGKKYLFYTLNEKVDNDLTKLYIAETNETAGISNSISDSEWEDLRKKMVKINRKEEVEDIRYLSMSNINFYVGDPKKLAVTTVAKQAFKDAQMSHVIGTSPINNTINPSSTTSFFNQEVVSVDENQSNVPVSTEESIFANPPQPIAVEQPVMVEQPIAVEQPVMVEQPIVAEQPVIVEQPIIAEQPVIVEQPIIAEQPVMVEQPIAVEQPVMVEQPIVAEQPVMVEQPIVAEQPVMVEQPIVAEQPVMVEQPIIAEQISPMSTLNTTVASPIDNNYDNKIDLTTPIISDEEALKAINIIQEYLEQESEM